MSEEYLDYASTQYLGRHGVTRKCMLAMAAILTGPYRPEKITAVIGSFDDSGNERVLFLVWDWGYPGITIVSDGFGTHGGEGGRGLSAALGLIKHYQIPLLEVRVYDPSAFHELALGTLTEEMFDTVQEAQRDYDWNFYRLPQVQKVRTGKDSFLVITLPEHVNHIFEVQLLP